MHQAEFLEGVLKLAAQEAQASGYAQITPAHLLISLARFTEADSPADASVAGALREAFASAGMEPRTFRRALRSLLGNRGEKPPDGVMHRSARCKAVFAVAGQLAAQAGIPVDGRHLFYAALYTLSVDEFAAAEPHTPKAAAEGADEIPHEL